MLSVSKLYFVAALLLGASIQAQAHAIISPALGVTGTPARSDVQRPSKNAECGSANIATDLNTVTPIVAKADGSFAATITNFNAGTDGSRQVTALVDPSGTGKSFTAATVTTNGDKAPTDVGSQQLALSLPAGTKCAGGTAGNLCLVSFTTAGGFGNCVAVMQAAASAGTGAVAAGAAAGAAGAAAAGAAGAASSAAAASTAAVDTAAAAATATAAATTGAKHHHKGAAGAAKAGAAGGAAAAAKANAAKAKAKASRAYGARLARAFRAAMEELA